MKWLRLLLAAILLGVIVESPVVALASDISTATYSGNIVVTNNSTAATAVSTNMSLSSADMISQNWVDSAFTRCAVRNATGADVPFMPGYGANVPMILWVPTIGANTNMNYILYTGPSNMASTKYYFPGATGMAVTDNNTNLEPGANWTATFRGFVNTDSGAGKSILLKQDALQIVVSPTESGNITATIGMPEVSQLLLNQDNRIYVGSVTRAGERFNSLPIGDYTVVPSIRKQGAPPGNFSVTMRAVAGDGLIGTFVTMLAGSLGVAYDYYSFGSVNNPAVQDVRIQIEYNDVGSDIGNNVQLSNQTGASTYSGGVYTSYNAGYTDIANDDATFRLRGTVLPVSVLTVPSGEMTVIAQSDSVNFWLTAETSTTHYESANVTTGSVPNNASNWQIADDNATRYMQYSEITIGGNQRGFWKWGYNGGYFTDDSGSGNTATPSFRTACSDPDVSATLMSFGPISTATAPAYAVSGAGTFITAAVTASGTFITGNVTGSHFPGSDIIDDTAESGDTPNIWVWGILAIFTIALSGLVISFMERHFGTGNGTLLFRFLAGVLIIGLLVTLGKFDWWMLLMYCFIAGLPLIASRQYDIGASVAELNLVGFLSMTWIGLTTINRILQAQLITASDTAHMNYLMFTQEQTIFGLFKIPIMNFEFWTKGLPGLVRWDYSFFGGNAQIIQYMLYSITAVLALVIFSAVLGLVTSYFTRAR